MIEAKVDTKMDPRIIALNEMKPYDIGVIINGDSHNGNIVMRTARIRTFEVMDISSPSGDGSCWDRNNSINVRLFEKGEKITLTVI